MKKDKTGQKSKISIVIILDLVMIIGVLIFSVLMAADCIRYSAKANDNKIQTTELENELASLKSKETISKDEVSETLYSATTAGKAVADAQNEYSKLNPESSDYSERIKAISGSIKQYYSDEDVGSTNQWFYAPETEYEWKFLSTYSFGVDKINVIWVCYSKNNDILAFTTAEYDVKADCFAKSNPRYTDLGSDAIAGEDALDSVQSDNEHIADLVSKMKGAKG